MSVENHFELDLQVSRSLLEALQPGAIEKSMDDLYISVGNFIGGNNEGQTSGTSIIGRHFTKSNKERYEFPPLSPKYAKWKKKKVGNKPILVFSGRWKKLALMNETRKVGGGKFVLRPVHAPSYAKYLEKGTPKMPARPAFTVNREDVEKIVNYARRVVKGWWGKLANVQEMVKVV